MRTTKRNHEAFWKTVAELLKDGQPIVDTLERAKQLAAGSALEPAAAALIEQLHAGKTLSDAMSPQSECFTPMVCSMVRCGEAGGVLDVIAERIHEGIKRGAFPLPGRKPSRKKEAVMFWRALGVMISSGTPVLHAFELLAEEIRGRDLADAARAVRQSILDGGKIADAMQRLPDVFPEPVCAAVALGERSGSLDEQALKIADALEAVVILSGLPAEAASGGVQAPVRAFTNRLALAAVRSRASDIHLDPTEGGGGRIRLRVDGVLSDYSPPAGDDAPAEAPFAEVVNCLKVMAALDVAERRLPQDGRIVVNAEGRELDLRVSCIPTVWGERVTMRILDRVAQLVSLEDILLEEDLKTVKGLCDLGHGLVLCSGPTGSGKTTLLYAMINAVNRDRRNVLSIENPVEYVLEGVAQIEVRPKIGLTFARAMRSVLRQDPDVDLVGEIRDFETMMVTIEAVLTGHLVLTTLHTNTAPGVARRMVDIGVEPYLVNSTLAGVIAQRLVRKLCPACRKPAEVKPSTLPAAAVEFVEDAKDAEFCAPVGCEKCRGLGYRGRTAIHEILLPDDRFREAVAANAGAAALREAALAGGMKPMLANGLTKAARGITSVEEVVRVAPVGPNV